jgi:hypothetical protein
MSGGFSGKRPLSAIVGGHFKGKNPKTFFMEEFMKRMIFTVLAIGFLASGLAGCFSSGPAHTDQNPAASQSEAQAQEKSETQFEKYQRLLLADNEKLVAGSDNVATIESIEAAFKPQIISGIDEITDAKLREPGRPYYFKIRSIYKGYDKEAKLASLQDLGQTQSNVMDTVVGTVFGIDTNAYQVMFFDAVVSTFPPEANSVATFYLVAARFTEDEGRQINETGRWIRFIRNIENPAFDPSKFIVVSGMHYITVADAHVPTREEVMGAYFFGGAIGNSSDSVFDPVVYPLVDLMDARVAMDKKDIRNDYTFPTVKVKYVSEVVFKGQSNTTVTVSTTDNILTERMNFTGRASAVQNREKVRVYYTIAKDPFEEWQIQAIERL